MTENTLVGTAAKDTENDPRHTHCNWELHNWDTSLENVTGTNDPDHHLLETV